MRNQSQREKSQYENNVDSAGLAKALAHTISGEVRFDRGSRALYSTDGSNYRQVPIGVVVPRSKEDVIDTVALCRKFGAPVLSRGGGTSLAGQCCNVAVVMDMSKYYNKILEIDYENKWARVQPGLVLDELREKAEEKHLTFAPDPSTHTHCTLGGMIGNNSCGVHSVMGGKTDDNVIELEALLYDGTIMKVGGTSDEDLEGIMKEGGRRAEIFGNLLKLRDRYGKLIRERFPDIPRRVSGYNIDHLLPEKGFHVARALVGSESTCVVVLEAKLRLVDSPPCRTLVVLGYPDVYEAGDHVTKILPFGPVGLEAVDGTLVENMKKKNLHPQNAQLLPDGNGWLLVEFGADSKAAADSKARAMMADLKLSPGAPTMKLFEDKDEEEIIWKVRESGLGATARVPGEPDTWEGWEDSAVPPDKVGPYLRELRKLYNRYGYSGALYGHFGQGCIHTRIDFDLVTTEGIGKFHRFLQEAAKLVTAFGGSISGEHGDGQSKAELLPIMFGKELIKAFEEFKTIWDPDWKMNPGKVVKPFSAVTNLRLGANYSPPEVKTHFRFDHDGYDFARATTRCVGVGKCRRDKGGVMCPSYMATGEEMHSTRGRARLLFEMLQGDVVTRGWRDKHVHEALDLCLACKGCKGDCPVNVDMATYKAEFLSHYYKGRLRPRNAYSMGLISVWSRLASPFPGLANFVTQTKGLSSVAKFAAGISQDRKIPPFAGETFKNWFAKRDSGNSGKPPVILWADTFNNFFKTEAAKAAVDVLEDAGFHVIVPKAPLCCGRPLYDFGMLDMAKRWLKKILVELRAEIQEGVPVVGLEPSCVAVFKDELGNLFPFDKDAQRLKEQSFLLGDFLMKKVENYQPPQFDNQKALVKVHCHQESVMDSKGERHLLHRLGIDAEELETGCCGMAGSFGFESEHYGVSQIVGERMLFPAVRKAPESTLIIANGFSCREQIEQATGRRPLHLAEVIQRSLQERRRAEPGKRESGRPVPEVFEAAMTGHISRPGDFLGQ